MSMNKYLKYAEEVWESVENPNDDEGTVEDATYILTGIFAVLMALATKDQS